MGGTCMVRRLTPITSRLGIIIRNINARHTLFIITSATREHSSDKVQLATRGTWPSSPSNGDLSSRISCCRRIRQAFARPLFKFQCSRSTPLARTVASTPVPIRSSQRPWPWWTHQTVHICVGVVYVATVVAYRHPG